MYVLNQKINSKKGRNIKNFYNYYNYFSPPFIVDFFHFLWIFHEFSMIFPWKFIFYEFSMNFPWIFHEILNLNIIIENLIFIINFTSLIFYYKIQFYNKFRYFLANQKISKNLLYNNIPIFERVHNLLFWTGSEFTFLNWFGIFLDWFNYLSFLYFFMW